jgi:hypothetical protein
LKADIAETSLQLFGRWTLSLRIWAGAVGAIRSLPLNLDYYRR